MTTVRNLSRFWSRIELLSGQAAVREEWRQLLGEEFDLVRPFLRVRLGRSDSFPNSNGGLPYEVRDLRGEFVGVCPETGRTILLNPNQLVVHELDCQRLSEGVAAAFGIDRTGAEEHRGGVLDLGQFTSAADARHNCFLTIPVESTDVQLQAAELIAERNVPFILFTPTRRYVRRAVTTLLKFQGCALVVLAETLSLCDPGRFVASRPLERMLAQTTGVVSVATTGGASPNTFKLDEGMWAVGFGGKTVRLRDSLGLKYLACLIASKRLPIDAAILKAAAIGRPPVKPDDGFAVFDKQGWEECRAKYFDLVAELEEASACNDIARQQRLQEHMGVLVGELQSARGLGGRDRKKKDQSDSIRTAVKNAIDRTVKILAKKHPELAHHIDISVTTGQTLKYDPVPDVEWDL